MDTGLKQWTSRSKSRGWFYECRVRKPTLASVFSFGWGQTLALLVACQHITGTTNRTRPKADLLNEEAANEIEKLL